MTHRLMLVVGLSISLVSAMSYNGAGAAAYAQTWQDWRTLGHDNCENYFDQGGNCCKFVSRCVARKSGGGVKFWGVKEETQQGDCKRTRIIHPEKHAYDGSLDKQNHFISISELKVCLSDWGVPIQTYTVEQLKQGVPSGLQVGDLLLVDGDGHIMIVVEIDWENGIIYFADHHGSIERDKHGRIVKNTAGFFCRENLVDCLKRLGRRNKPTDCRIARMPSTIKECMDVKQTERWDSTFHRARVRHQWVCCWHEQLGEQSPWTTNPTPYACLSWSQSSGTTWDTLIYPRVNLAGCSSAVLVQACTTNLLHGSNKTIEVRGSTDDGATWPYLIGTDTLTEASLPWATNQRNVRIAWIYKGPVQDNRFWCIDYVRVLAKPTRYRDVCVSEIREPGSYGGVVPTVTAGKVIRPIAFLWNSGRQDETVSVAMKIGTVYTDSQTMVLFPYYDTLVEFAPWNASPGTYTATCHVLQDSDEFRNNDSTSQTFRVVADTWVRMFPVYGGGGMEPGACMAPTDSDNIYCVTGKSDWFAKYVVTQNLWKNRTPTPENFGSGSALAHPGTGNNLYALRGGSSKSLYRYRADYNYWETRAQTPDRMGAGAALAWGGGDYLYALRGNQKKDFYRYSIASNSWQAMAQTPGNIKGGGSLVWTGDDFLYALRGGDHPDFYRYQISTNTWVSRASTPVSVDQGGALAFYPLANKIYAFFGNGAYYFYAYDISNNTWSPRRTAPGPVKNGAFLTYCDYSIYGGLGAGRDTNFWRYSPPVGGYLDESEPAPAPSPVKQIPSAVYGDAPGYSSVGDEIMDYDPTDKFSPGTFPDHAPADGSLGEQLLTYGSTGKLSPGSSPDYAPAYGSFGEELLTYDPTDKLTPDYSPSDSWITYTANDTTRNCFALYRIRSIGGPPVMVSFDNRTYENPKWSHNGAWLIAKADDGIFRLQPNGMMPLKLTEGVTALPRWSGNDSWVIYERWDTTLHTHRTCQVRSDGTQDTCLSVDSDEYLEPQPVSDSEVVCVKLKDEVYQLCLVRNGQTIWLTSDYMNNASPCLSPDREWCTYEKLDESGYWQVYRIRLTGADETRLSGGTCNCKTPTYSPDGNHIAYSKWPADLTGSSEFSQICYVPDSGGQETALNPPDAIRTNPCWSHANTYIVYQRTVESGALGGGKKRFAQLARARTRIRYSGVEELTTIPDRFALYQNRPNPFHAVTTIRYALPTPTRTDLTIYDIAGRSVKKLVQYEQKAGYYSVRWNGSDARGRSVPAGTYFYVLKANGKIAQKRMLLVR